MPPIVKDGVVWSVCLSVTIVSPAKTAEPIEVPFGMCTRVDPCVFTMLTKVFLFVLSCVHTRYSTACCGSLPRNRYIFAVNILRSLAYIVKRAICAAAAIM